MEIIKGVENINIYNDSAVCIGNFDGLHLGHRSIISVLKKESVERGLKSVILTFNPHPFKFFHKEIQLISTPKKRLEKFYQQEIDYLVILDFNSELANLSPEDFFKNILVDKLHAKLVVVGQDYKFGSGKSGNTELLSLLGRKYGVDTMFAHKLHDRKGNIISSSRIRELLINGEVDEASRLLSMPYSLEGVIIHGDKRGRQLGYPTINLDVENEMLPLFGVYAAKVMLGGKFYNAMAYVGMRPTINNKMELRVEANIFDFNMEIYGEYAEIILYKYIRGDIKFNSIDELIIQMGKDKEDVSAYLKQVDDYKVNLG